MAPTGSIRVLIAKPGLDGHDKGAKIVARGLQEAGMEVIYTGIRQTPGAIATAAVQESADVIGLSILSGAHLSVCAELMEALARADAADKLVLVGGIVPKKDVARLEEMGVAQVFGPETAIAEIDRCIRERLEERRSGPARKPGA